MHNKKILISTLIFLSFLGLSLIVFALNKNKTPVEEFRPPQPTQTPPAEKLETINKIPVPPAPDEALNEKTVEGIDSNSNGLRDDVERKLAEDFGYDLEFYQEIKQHALTLQLALVDPTPKNVNSHLDSFRCIDLEDNWKLSDFTKSTKATINTPLRADAYENAFAEATISKEECPK